MKKALIIVDLQNDYFPGGTMEDFKECLDLTAAIHYAL